MGKELSIGLSVAWQISAQEAAAAKSRFIEKEHVLIGVCSLAKAIRPITEQGKLPPAIMNELQLEKEDVLLVLGYFGLDATATRRQLRRMMGVGDYILTGNVVHRSEECKRVFAQAEALSSSNTVSVLHFLAALMKNPGNNILRLLSEKSIKTQDVAEFALSIANQQEPSTYAPRSDNSSNTLYSRGNKDLVETRSTTAPASHLPSDVDNGCQVPTEVMDKVHFSITSPDIVSPCSSFVLDVWAHLESQRDEIIKLAQAALPGTKIRVKTKGPVCVQNGTVLTVRLTIEDLEVEDREDTIMWDNQIGVADFLVSVPQTVANGSKNGIATINANGIQISRIYFTIQVGNQITTTTKLDIEHRRNRKAFASYASADREYVLSCIQGMQKIAPQLEIFLDVVSLRSDQYWEDELWNVIPSNDVFFLFWSANSAKSSWVEKEWKCALKTRGLDFIDPVPLEDPERVPPPLELSSKHFGDWVLAYRQKLNR